MSSYDLAIAISTCLYATACGACAAGKYQNATGQSGCRDCPSGTASAESGATDSSVCEACPPGTSTRGDRAQATCTPCAAGSFAGPGSGAVRCESTPVGHYAAAEGATEAAQCAPGTHAPTKGLLQCLPCPDNTYQPYNGKSSCSACPDGAESQAGSVTCRCSAGHAASAVSGGGLLCVPCPPGWSTRGEVRLFLSNTFLFFQINNHGLH
jgi:hypothetical protein